MLNRSLSLAGFLPLIVLLASCGGGGGNSSGTGPTGNTPPPPPPVTYAASSGVAQKGPLIKGSTVTAQELDAALSPTGKQYSYQITSDLGTFEPSSTFTSQYLGVSANGYYFDETRNGVSSGPITLYGYSDLTVDTKVNVNLLTTLAYQRIKTLVGSGKSFATARTQAESEVLAALKIPAGTYGSFGALNLSGNSDGDHVLAAISALFVQGNQAGDLSALINNFQSDLGTNGKITSAAINSALTSAASSLDPAAVAINLSQRYQSLGVTLSAQNIADWIDRDGDGVAGKFKFRVTGATASSVFTFPAVVVSAAAGGSVSVDAGQLAVNGSPATGAVTVNAGDVVTVSPGAGPFANGVRNVYLLRGDVKVARVSFVSGLLSIEVTPNAANIAKGLSQQFKAVGSFSDSSTGDITSSVTWTSAPPGVATVNPTTGLTQAVAAGSASITATSGLVSGSAALTVRPLAAETLVISPSARRSGVGLNRQLIAQATYSDGTTSDVTAVANWSSSTPAVATVGDHTGLTTGVSLGSTNITATIDSVSASAPLTIVGNSWSSGASLALPRVMHLAVTLANGKVLLIGGGTAGTPGHPNTTAELYDFATDKWTQLPGPTVPREQSAATLLPNGKVLVTGSASISTGAGSNTAELYDPVANTWTAAAPMSTVRYSHSSTLLLNGKVLVAGGVGNLNTAELYDPATNTWSAAASLPDTRTEHTATLLDNGKVLVVAGSPAQQRNALLYDPTANTWTATAGSMVVARVTPVATKLADGRVLVTGGYDLSNNDASAKAEIYDPVSDTWSPAGLLNTGRINHTATLLPNGKVMIVAGVARASSQVTVLNTVELYDPATQISTLLPSLANARYQFATSVLPNGVVVVTGGDNHGILSSTELYW